MNARFFYRILRACLLDPVLYEEVESDKGATLQALAVVVLASLAAGVAAWNGFASLVLSLVAHLAAWVAWSLLIYVIGARLLPEPQTRSDPGELLRTLGFAASPGLFRVLQAVRPISAPAFWLISLWMLATMVLAVRQALDYQSTLRAVLVCGLGWAVHVLFLAIATTSVF